MKVRVKSWEEVDYLFPKETSWKLYVDEIHGDLRYSKENSSKESNYHINHSLQRRETKNGRFERSVIILSEISSKENTLSFYVCGPKRLVSERQKEIDVAKSVISAIVLDVTHDE